jgi:hypothetical protein
MNELIKAGLLAFLIFRNLPIHSNSGYADSENTMQKVCIRITATGIAPELNRIPILIPLIGGNHLRVQM